MKKDTFTLSFETENAAFDGIDALPEVAFILRTVAEGIVVGSLDGQIVDSNGNHVGSWNWDRPDYVFEEIADEMRDRVGED